jgi:hypothetical protein
MKRVLVIWYSQTGQLIRFTRSALRALEETPAIKVVYEELQPAEPFPFPWKLSRFVGAMPEAVTMVPCELKPVQFDPDAEFDLIVLAYPVWFLAPATPVTSFLKSPAARVLRGRSVITIVDSHGIWLQAQEKVKGLLAEQGAILIDNIVVPDQGGTFLSTLTAPRWMLSGRRDRLLGVFPPAGASESTISDASRFGPPIRDALLSNAVDNRAPLLVGYGAASVDWRFIGNEKIALRIFSLWAKAIRAAGPSGSPRRNLAQTLFVIYLVVAVGTLLPLTFFVKTLFAPLLRKRIAREQACWEGPSGSGRWHPEG